MASIDERLRLVFDEACRALEQQAARRDDLRHRAGALVAAASIATAFLGGQALEKHARFSAATWIAIGAFVAIIALSIYVLTPRKGWIFVTSARSLLAHYVEADNPATLDEMHRELALHFEDDYDANARGLDHLTSSIQASCVLLLVEIAAWLVAMRGG